MIFQFCYIFITFHRRNQTHQGDRDTTDTAFQQEHHIKGRNTKVARAALSIHRIFFICIRRTLLSHRWRSTKATSKHFHSLDFSLSCDTGIFFDHTTGLGKSFSTGTVGQVPKLSLELLRCFTDNFASAIRFLTDVSSSVPRRSGELGIFFTALFVFLLGLLHPRSGTAVNCYTISGLQVSVFNFGGLCGF